MVMFSFSVLDLFLQVLFEMAISHIDFTWLISQQFTRRDLKPVDFLVIINIMAPNWETYSM